MFVTDLLGQTLSSDYASESTTKDQNSRHYDCPFRSAGFSTARHPLSL
jgi:hypothetical protein